MADDKFGIQHCDATVADFAEIADKCPCMKCVIVGCKKCTVWQLEKYKTVCIRCRFHNGR